MGLAAFSYLLPSSENGLLHVLLLPGEVLLPAFQPGLVHDISFRLEDFMAYTFSFIGTGNMGGASRCARTGAISPSRPSIIWGFTPVPGGTGRWRRGLRPAPAEGDALRRPDDAGYRRAVPHQRDASGGYERRGLLPQRVYHRGGQGAGRTGLPGGGHGYVTATASMPLLPTPAPARALSVNPAMASIHVHHGGHSGRCGGGMLR